MGVEPFLLSSALKMIISQRLGKKLCQNCKTPETISDIMRKKIKSYLLDIMEEADIDAIQFYTGAGCERCHGTGYKGRLGIHEVLIVEEYLEPLIMA